MLAESEIVATETKGNSDESAKSKICLAKVTPDSPVIEANEERVNVEVTQKVNQQN